MVATNAAPRAAVGMYRDVRGDERWLRLTWHPAHRAFVLSIWRDDVCAASFQMTRGTSAGLVSDLVQTLSEPIEIALPEPVESGVLSRLRSRIRQWASDLRRHRNGV